MNTEAIYPTVSPRAQALSVYIEQCVKQLAQVESESGPATEALLFLGNWHDSIPRLLWRDPILEAIDVRVWGIIMTCAHAQNATAFPSYDEIARLANVARGTVARAMMILRTTRWISVCGRIHDHQGRYRGNIYALHDEPVSLADTIHLDHGYMQFLHRTTQHKHPRVRKVAQAVLATIEDDIAADHDVTTDFHTPMEQRLVAWQLTEKSVDTSPKSQSRFYSISRRRLAELASKESAHAAVQNVNSGSVQNLNSVEIDKNLPENQNDMSLVQNLNAYCSSRVLNKKTTTTNKRPEAKNTEASNEQPYLHFPPRLTASERTLSRMYLEALSDDQRQAVLDELHGRLLSADKGGTPVHNPIGYLVGLCGAAKAGTFQLTSLGLRIQERRERSEALTRAAARRDAEFTKQVLERSPPSDPWAKRMDLRFQAIKDKKDLKEGNGQ